MYDSRQYITENDFIYKWAIDIDAVMEIYQTMFIPTRLTSTRMNFQTHTCNPVCFRDAISWWNFS